MDWSLSVNQLELFWSASHNHSKAWSVSLWVRPKRPPRDSAKNEGAEKAWWLSTSQNLLIDLSHGTLSVTFAWGYGFGPCEKNSPICPARREKTSLLSKNLMKLYNSPRGSTKRFFSCFVTCWVPLWRALTLPVIQLTKLNQKV